MKKLFVVLMMLAVAALGFGRAGGEAPGQTVTLTWYYPGTYPQPDQDEVFAACNKIIKPLINATVDFKAIDWNAYDDKMNVVTASGEPWDLAFTASWTFNYPKAVGRGALLPLDDLLKKDAPKLFAAVPKAYWDAVRIDGKIYGIINNQIQARAAALSVPKEYMDKMGISSLQAYTGKLSSLEPMLDKVKQLAPDKIPFVAMYQEISDVLGQEWIVDFSVPGAINLADATAKVFNQFTSPEFVDFINLMKTWNQKGYLGGERLLGVTDTTELNVQHGSVVSIGGTYKPGGQEEESAKYGWALIQVPMRSPAYLTTAGITSTMHGIGRNSRNPDRAMMLMEQMNSNKTLYNTLTFGIEGKHYKKLSGDYIELVKDSGYNPATPWLHASTFSAYLLPGQPADVWEQTKKVNAAGKPSPLLGFSFNAEPVKTEIAQTSSVCNEYLGALALGLRDVDTDYQAFISKLDKAGAEKILSEIQKQIDTWRKGREA